MTVVFVGKLCIVRQQHWLETVHGQWYVGNCILPGSTIGRKLCFVCYLQVNCACSDCCNGWNLCIEWQWYDIEYCL